MPRKLSPEEAAVMIIRRRLQQREEDRMAQPERDERRNDPLEPEVSPSEGDDQQSKD